MSLKNCKRCGKLFNSKGLNVCQHCMEKDAVDFERIRDYMSKHPTASVLELTRETGVDAAVITRFRREGRLMSRDKLDGVHLCAACGIPISAGGFCGECTSKLRSATAKGQKKTGPYRRP